MNGSNQELVDAQALDPNTKSDRSQEEDTHLSPGTDTR